jgi:phosphoribosylglycinamide formyltransferase 1
MKTRTAIVASGSGTTAEAFIRAAAAGQVDADVVLVVTNNQAAGVLERVKELNNELGLHIATMIISGKTHPPASNEVVAPGSQTQAEQQALITAFHDYGVELVLLLGFMKKIGHEVVNEFGWRPGYASPYQARMLNTHPGLLPQTKGFIGVHVQEHVLAKGWHEAGQTLHIVSEQYDDGPTIGVHTVAVEPSDTAETLFARVQATEKAQLPRDVDTFIKAQQAYRKEQ